MTSADSFDIIQREGKTDTMASPVFPLRFKDPATKDMLRLVADQLGVSMTDLAEDAVRQELMILGAGLEQQLTDIVEALRSYRPDDSGSHIATYAAGEACEDDPMRARQLVVSTPPRTRSKKEPAVVSESIANGGSELADALKQFKAR
jgi:hypothetical protein